MSYTLNIPFENLTCYQGNARTHNNPHFSEIAVEGLVWLGSNWNGTTSTVFNIGKIKIKIADLGLPNSLPQDTKIKFSIKNTTNWCGAGYLRGHVSTKDLEVVDIASWETKNNTTDSIERKDISEGRLCICTAIDFTWAKGSTGKTVEFSGTLSEVADLSGIDCLYIYIIDTVYDFGNPGSTTTIFSSTHMSFSFDLPYTAVGDPSKSDSEGLKINGILYQGIALKAYRDDTIQLSWGAAEPGANNPVKGYRLYYGLRGYPYSQTKDIGPKTTTYSFIIKDDFGGPKKKTIFWLSVQALAEKEEMHSNTLFLGEVEVINKAPDAPTFEIKEALRINPGATSTLTISNLKCVDVDGDNLTYQYSLSSSEISAGSWADLPDSRKIIASLSAPYVFIRATDSDGAKSESSCQKAGENTKPIIEATFTGINTAVAQDNNDKIYTRYLTITPTISKFTTEIIGWNWRVGTEGNLGDFSQIQNPTKVEVFSGTGGQKLKSTLEIIDKIGDKFTYNFDIDYYKLYDIGTLSNFSASAIKETFKNSKMTGAYLDKSFKISVQASTFSNDDISRKIKLYLGTKDSSKNWNQTMEFEAKEANREGAITSYSFDFDFNYNTLYYFKVCLIDDTERISQYIESTGYELLPKFDVSSFSMDRQDWQPLSTSLNADTPITFSTSFQDSDTYGKNYYKIEAKINNQSSINLIDKIYFGYSDSEWTVSKSGTTISFEISNYNLYKKLNIPTNAPVYNITYIVTGYNTFGISGASLQYQGTITTQHAPSFKKDDTLSVEVTGINLGGYTNWFNPGETLTFTLSSTPTDLNSTFWNGEEKSTKIPITQYEISYSWAGDTVWKILETKEISSSVPNSFTVTAPDFRVQDKKQLQFRLRAKDDTNLYSDYIVSNELYACRKVNPIVAISEVELDASSNFNIALQIDDFGGNNKGKENFNRADEEEYTIQLDYSIDNETFKTEFITGKLKNLTTKFNYIFDNEDKNATKFYLKIKLVIQTDSTGTTVSNFTPVYVFLAGIPTMSHRAHWIGINSTDNDSDTVFQVYRFSDSKYKIRLTGLSDTKVREIQINLDTGEITGAVINGGTW